MTRGEKPRALHLAPFLVKHDSLVSVAEDAAAHVRANGAGENHALQIAAARNQILHLVAMRDPRHILLDDWAIVQHVGNEMACRTDELDPARVGRVVGPGSSEGRQKRMMHIDDGGRVAGHECGRENLHVAGQYHEFDAVLREQFELAGFGFGARRIRPAFRLRDDWRR